ncbi:hypothetical protein B0H13DRAFT_1851170 [Mycena leptocephala]|nr:hypothetical protein B0H13DRAFT_1851170 [Mycena leptocephala]
MSGLPNSLKIPDGPERLSLPPNNLPVSSLIKFPLPLHKHPKLISSECRPCPPLPLHGPNLLEVAVPALSLHADPHLAAPAVPVSGGSGNTSSAVASKTGNKHKPPVCQSRGLAANMAARDPRLGNTPCGWLATVD